MTLWYKRLLVLVAGGVVYLAGQYFRGVWISPSWPLPCNEIHSGSTVYCNALYLDTLGWPLIALGQMLAAIWFILLLADEKTLRTWCKFSDFYIPIAVLLSFAIYPIRFFPNAELLPVSYGVYPFGSLYILLTLIIVLWSRWQAHKTLHSA